MESLTCCLSDSLCQDHLPKEQNLWLVGGWGTEDCIRCVWEIEISKLNFDSGLISILSTGCFMGWLTFEMSLTLNRITGKSGIFVSPLYITHCTSDKTRIFLLAPFLILDFALTAATQYVNIILLNNAIRYYLPCNYHIKHFNWECKEVFLGGIFTLLQRKSLFYRSIKQYARECAQRNCIIHTFNSKSFWVEGGRPREKYI